MAPPYIASPSVRRRLARITLPPSFTLKNCPICTAYTDHIVATTVNSDLFVDGYGIGQSNSGDITEADNRTRGRVIENVPKGSGPAFQYYW